MSFSLVVPGTPPRKNRKHRVFANRGRVARALHPEYRAFRDRVAVLCTRAGEPVQRFAEGRVVVIVDAFWPRRRHLDVAVGFGDVDAPVECVLDALQHCGVIDDDSRVVELHAFKHHDSDNPRVEVYVAEAPSRVRTRKGRAIG